VALLLAAWLVWPGGVDFVYLKRTNLLIAAATVLWLLVRHAGATLAREQRHDRLVLGVLAAAAVTTHVNYFAFHGREQPVWTHYHDVAHYYLGSRYFAELGYGRLYTAMLRAEAEVYQNHFKTIEARNLATGGIVHVRSLLQESGPVKAAFSPQRWAEFCRDVALFRELLGPQYGAVLRDHGFNPTPAWALLGGSLANLVPAGSRAGVFALTLLDPLLLCAAFAGVGRAFGTRVLLLAVIHYCVIFGSSFGWTGGAFLRQLWLAGTLGAACLLGRQRAGLAGVLLGIAAAVRVFPVAFAAAAGARLAFARLGWGPGDPRDRRFLLALAATVAGLVAVSALGPRGPAAWSEFRNNIEVHLNNTAPNRVGLGVVVGHAFPETRGVSDGTSRARVLALVLGFAPVLAWSAVRARRAPGLDGFVLGVPLVLTGLDLSAYYYVFLAVLTLHHRDSSGRLAAVFGLELACHVLMLFEESEAALYAYRSLLLCWLLVGLHARERRSPPLAEQSAT
jgi:hypothetical protein